MLEIRVRQDSLIILSHHSNFNTALPLWWGELNWMRLLTQSYYWVQFSSVQFSCSVGSNVWWLHALQHARPPCPSPVPGACSNSCLSSRWCHPTISSSVIPFSSCLQSFPASGSFPRSQFVASGGQSIEVSASASVIPMNIQDWFPLGWAGWISQESSLIPQFKSINQCSAFFTV